MASRSSLSADKVTIEPPVKYPWNLMNMAFNYWGHAKEMSGKLPDIDQDRDDPFIFAKSPRSDMIGTDATFYIPEGREKMDWEGELIVVMGPKPASRVSKEQALGLCFWIQRYQRSIRPSARKAQGANVQHRLVLTEESGRRCARRAIYHAERIHGQSPRFPSDHEGQRSDQTGWQHKRHDLRRRAPDRLYHFDHDTLAWRYDCLRITSWRWYGTQTT